MKFFRNKFTLSLIGLALISSSCDNFFDINKDPANTLDAPLSNQLPSLTSTVGYTMGSDLQRFSALLTQQYAGQSTGPETQTQLADKYQISGQDLNNAFSSIYASILNDAKNIIDKADAQGSPAYSGVAKLLSAYTYQVSVDAWGDLPFSEAQKLTANLYPAYDDDKDIYADLITLIDDAIADINQVNSIEVPGTNSTIYPGTWATVRSNWIKFANTLKLRIYLHYSEVDPAFAKQQIDALIASGAVFFTSNADNFQMTFVNSANSRNPIDQMETGRAGYLAAGFNLVDMMNAKADPRRAFYFTQYPANSGTYLGSLPGAPSSQNYSKFHEYLRGKSTTAANGSVSYTGAAPIRMLTFAEYNFIRAEAALRFASPGSAQTFFTAGITASMTDAGVATADINTYLAANGTLAGTDAEMLEQIIDEKYVASYGVVMEPWTDWRRTGYPTLTLPSNAVIGFTPRSLYYPQNEVDFNSSLGGQKASLDVRVFWDTRP